MKKTIVLAHFPKITQKRYQDIIRAFSSLEIFWSLEFDEIQRKLPWNEGLLNEFLLWRDAVDEGAIANTLEREGIFCVTKDDPAYPPLLKEIYDPPFCLFVRGQLEPYTYPLAVVGTRKYTGYGKQVTEEIVSPLVRSGLAIVSGLALGIDGFAHDAALRANGKTVAVLGSGIDQQHIYPARHKPLAERIIASGGAVVSEYPPGTLPTKFSFPRRNRIIAGMSLGTLVVEAAEKSGALITATCSLDNNREVFAIPQNITSKTSTGPNRLLKEGATPVTSAEDILEALHLQDIKRYVTNTNIVPDSPTEAALLKHLSREAIHVDELIKKSGLPGHAVSGALTIMEMKGKIKNLGGMMYVVAR
jgi:DNA processing protein